RQRRGIVRSNRLLVGGGAIVAQRARHARRGTRPSCRRTGTTARGSTPGDRTASSQGAAGRGSGGRDETHQTRGDGVALSRPEAATRASSGGSRVMNQDISYSLQAEDRLQEILLGYVE